MFNQGSERSSVLRILTKKVVFVVLAEKSIARRIFLAMCRCRLQNIRCHGLATSFALGNPVSFSCR
jgi:hypothetical protein